MERRIIMVNQIVSITKSIVQKMPNLERRFPTEESRYSAYIKFLYLALVCGALGRVLDVMNRPTVHMVGYRQVVEEPSMLVTIFTLICSIGLIIASVCIVYTSLYIFVKSGTMQFLIRLLIGFLIGAILMAIITSIFGPVGTIISVIVAIIANRKRLAILKKYQAFVWYGLGGMILPFIFLIVGFGITLVGAYMKSSIVYLGFILALMVFVVPTLVIHYALRRERAKGRSFLETIRLLNIVPIICLCCFISYLTLTHISGLSGDSIFGPSGHDFLADPSMNTGSFDGIHDMDIAGNANINPTDTVASDESGMNSDLGHVSNNMGVAESSSAISSSTFPDSTGINFGDYGASASGAPDPLETMVDAGSNTTTTNFQNAFVHTTVQDGMGHTEIHATTNPYTNETVFQDNMSQTIGSESVNSVTGDATLHDTSGQTIGSISHDGAILNQLGLSEGHLNRMENGDILVLDAQDHLIQTIKSDGTILNPMNQAVGKIQIS